MLNSIAVLNIGPLQCVSALTLIEIQVNIYRKTTLQRMHITAILRASQCLIANVHCFMSAITSRKKFKRKRIAIQKFLLLNPVLKLNNRKRHDVK